MSALLERVRSFKLLSIAVLFFSGAYLAFTLLYLVPKNFPPDLKDIDASIYYAAAQDVIAGRSLYTPEPNYHPNLRPFTYLYLPPFAAVIAPMGYLSETAFARTWYCIQLAFYLAFPVVLVQLANVRLTLRSYLFAHVALVVSPLAYRAVGLGQVDAMIWVAFGVGILWLFSKRSWKQIGAGALLSGGALLKIYLAWALFRAAARNRVAFLSGMAVLGLALVLGGEVCSWGAYQEWGRWIPNQISQGTFNSDNWSLSMGVLRLARLLGWQYTGGQLTGLPLLWLKVVPLAAPALALWLTRKQPLPLAAAICAVIGALTSPICWTTYLPILFVPLAVWLRFESEKAAPVAGAA